MSSKPSPAPAEKIGLACRFLTENQIHIPRSALPPEGPKPRRVAAGILPP